MGDEEFKKSFEEEDDEFAKAVDELDLDD